MNTPKSLQPQPHRLVSRNPLWTLLLCSILWSLVTFGCATITYVTDVIYNENGNGAVVSFDIEIDEGVYNALREAEPSAASGIASTQQEAGWSTKESAGGRKILSRTKYETLAGLEGVPRLIVGEEGDPSDSFIQELSVVTKTVGENMVEYTFHAALVIAPPSGEADEGAYDPFADFPKLKAAIDAAGPAQIIVQTHLPGTIDPRSVSLAGEVEGGRVRWKYSEDEPGTYYLTAVSVGYLSVGAQNIFSDLYGSNERIQEFHDLGSFADWEREAALKNAAQSVVDLRRKQGKAEDDSVFTPKEVLLFEAAYFATFCRDQGVEKRCMMPNLYRALPLIEKLTERLGDDINSTAALAELVKGLYDNDINNLWKQ